MLKIVSIKDNKEALKEYFKLCSFEWGKSYLKDNFDEIVERKVEDVINEMVGEIALIIKAPEYGLQSKDIIPEEVLESYQKIVASGFDKYYYSDDMVKHLKDVLIEKGLDY